MSRVLILSAVIFSAASGCVAETTDPNVIGKYVSSLSCAGESIVLHADGRFTHRYDSRSEVGNWEIDLRGNRIIFQKFRSQTLIRKLVPERWRMLHLFPSDRLVQELWSL